MFYHFTQNNSGGTFTVNDNLSVDIIIEAPSANLANTIAEDLGIYFNGVDEGFDCDCCGDRWDPTNEREGTEVPLIYGEPLEKCKNSFYRTGVIVHYLNGEIHHVKFEPYSVGIKYKNGQEPVATNEKPSRRKIRLSE